MRKPKQARNMAIHKTQWTPDTCDNPPCIFEYAWDDVEPTGSVTHTLSTVIQKCPRHASQTDDDSYTNVKEENIRKNKAYQTVIDNVSVLVDTNVDGSKTLKRGITFSWSWSGKSPDTVLTITLEGATLTTNQKNTLQNALVTKLGAGKVVLV